MTPEELADGATSRSLSKWLVTSSHGVWQVTLDERSWVPYSVRHAREVGAVRAACGQLAIGWELFWDLPFAVDDPRACQACNELVSSDSVKPGVRVLLRWSMSRFSSLIGPDD
jgi:hypothetical protein